MADFTKGSAADMAAGNPGINMGTSGSMRDVDEYTDSEWEPHERHWREHFASRPYVQADRGYEHYRDAYRYGASSAARHRGREWHVVEPELEGGWTSARGASRSTWAEMKAAARDAWERARGRENAS
jgi:hypothetical protein